MDINNSILVTGTINILNDVITSLTAISLLITIIMSIYCLVRKSSCEEQEGKMLTKRLIVTISCSVLITLVKVIIQVVTSYYT